MAIKFLNNIQAEAANTPDIIVKDTTNNLIGRLRAANNYVYLTADHGDAVGSTRITFQVDGNAVGFFSNSLFSAETDVKFSTYGSGNNTGTLAYALAVDANGNVIESTIQSNPAGVDGTGTVDYLTKWLDGDTLTDSNVYEASGDLITTLNLKSSNSYPQLKLTDTDNSSTSSIRSAGGSLQYVLHNTSKAHVFYAENTATELMRITGTGLVGIGQSNPVENLEVYDADANTWVVVETGLNNAGTQYINTTSAWTVGIKANDSDSFYIGNQEGLSNGYLILDTSGNLQLTSYTAGYLKSDADGNITVDTSIIEDTLDSVTDRNATTTNAITVGGLTVDTDTLHVDATNNRVGIGTTSPQKPLHVQSANDAPIRVESTDATTGILFVDPDSSNALYYVGSGDYFYTSAKLGIGTTNPSQELHVVGNFRLTGEFVDSNNSGGLSGQILSSTGTGTDWVSLSEIQGVDGTGTANYLAKWSDIDTITDSVVYDDGTNVGIGTTSPATKLHITGDITGTNKLLIENTNDGTNSYAGLGFQSDFGHTYHPGILLNSSTNTAYGGVDSLNIWQYHSKPITLVTNNVVRAIVTGGGNVGIGTTAPNHKLEVAGNVGVDNYIYHNGDTNTYIKFDNDQITLYAGNHSVLSYDESTTSTFELGFGGQADTRIGAGNAAVIFQGGSEGSYDGKVGIGTTTPNGLLEVYKGDSGQSTAVAGGDNLILNDSANGGMSIFTPSTSLGSIFFGDESQSDVGWIRYNHSNDYMLFGTGGGTRLTIKNNGLLTLGAYSTGVLVTDASGNVTASTDYHTQETADARYVNVTGDTMTGRLTMSVDSETVPISISGSSHKYIDIATSTNNQIGIRMSDDNVNFIAGLHGGEDAFKISGHTSFGTNDYLTILDSGNVGIGTISPGETLDVVGNIKSQYNGNNYSRLGQNASGGYIQAYSGAIEKIMFRSYGDSFINGGNVGIGTTSPLDPLHISSGGSDDFIRIENTNTYTGLWMNDGGTNDGWLVMSGYTNTSSPGDFAIREYGVQTALVIKQTTGRVGIGTISPNALLDVNKSTIGEYAYFGSGSTRQLRLSSYNTVSDHAGHKINASSGNGEIILATNSVDALTVKNDQTIQLNAYTAGYVKSDANGNLTVDNSTFLQEEVDTLASVTSRGATTSQVTYFNGTVNIGASVGMTFSSSSEGATYTPTESTVGTSRYFLRFDTTDDASFPYLTNRTPSGAVVIKTGTAAGGAENEHFRIKGGDGTVDAYFTDANVGIGTDSPGKKLEVRSVSGTESSIRIRQLSYNFWDLKSPASDTGFTISDVGGEKLRITSEGNVGIGITLPSRKLHVNSGTTNHVAIFESTDATAWIQIKDNATASYISNTSNGLVIAADTNNEGADSNIRLLIDGSDQVTIDNNGDLRLHGYGAGYLKTDASGNVSLDTITSVVDGTGTGGYIPKWSDNNTLTDSIIQTSGNNVGFGVSPKSGGSTWQHIQFGGTGNIVSRISDASLDSMFASNYYVDGSNVDKRIVDGFATRMFLNSGDIQFDTAVAAATTASLDFTTKLIIKNGGNVGIGESTPSHKLTVDTGTGDFYIDEDTNINQGTGSSDTPAIFADTVLRVRQRVEIWDDNDGNNYLDIRDGSTQAIKLTPDGDSWFTNDLGLGTTSPAQKLHVVGASIIADGNTSIDPDINPNAVVAGAINDGSGWGVNSGIGGRAAGAGDTWAIGHNGSSLYMAIGGGASANSLSTFLRADTDGTIALEAYGAGFLKTDANGLVSVDTTSYTEAQTLDDVTDLGNTTTNGIEVGALNVDGRFVVDSKTMTITDSFSDALTVVMSNHTGCYVKITAFGDWGSHSSISYLGEFFLNNGAGSYNEPGMIIRQVDGTASDAIQAQIVDPGGTTGNRDFTIQLKATATASFTAYITYTIQGMFVSAS